MEKKLDMVLGGVELLVALGVSTLVGGALVLVKPSKLGVVKFHFDYTIVDRLAHRLVTSHHKALAILSKIG